MPRWLSYCKTSEILHKDQQKRVDGYNLFYETIKKGLENNTFTTFWKYR